MPLLVVLHVATSHAAFGHHGHSQIVSCMPGFRAFDFPGGAHGKREVHVGWGESSIVLSPARTTTLYRRETHVVLGWRDRKCCVHKLSSCLDSTRHLCTIVYTTSFVAGGTGHHDVNTASRLSFCVVLFSTLGEVSVPVFFCRTSLGTGARAVEVSLLGFMTKAAFDRRMGCHLFL